MRSPRDAAEARRERARLSLLNADYHRRTVGENLGCGDPSYLIAVAVEERARRELVAACDACLALDAEVSP